MKILFLIGSIAGGGLERRTVNIVNQLSENPNNEINLLTSSRQNQEYIVEKLVKRHTFLELHISRDIILLKKFINQKDIDVLIGMGIYASFLVCIARFVINCKVIVVEANDPSHDQISLRTRILRKLLYWNADGHIFQTKEEKKYYSKNIQKKSIVVHNPIMVNLPTRAKDIDKEIVAVGRLEAQKDYHTLIRAFYIVHKIHPDYKLRVFGQGNKEKELKDILIQLGIENSVIFEGFCLDVHEKIISSDIYVLTSLYEGMPNTLLEAMAMGFPVVSTDCGGGGPKEIIQDGYNGFLVPIGDAKAIASKINYLIENKSIKENMGKNALKIRKSHEVFQICKIWEEYIRKVICEI